MRRTFRILMIGSFCFGFSGLLLQGADPVTVIGYLEPYQSIELNPTETGMIEAINVSEGDVVKKGDPLLNLNKRVLEAQLSIAQIQAESVSAVEVAAADLELTKERHGKLAQLKKSGTAHSSEFARAEADLKKAEAQLNIANEEKQIAVFRVEEIQAEIEERILRSPIDGVVVEINRDIAESSIPSQEGPRSGALVKVAQIDKLRLVVHVPSAHADELAVGKTLRVRVLGQSSLSPDREASAVEASGIIEFISPTIDPSSETLRTRLVVDNAEGKLRSGSHVLVIIKSDKDS